jgi:hypothetical protein
MEKGEHLFDQGFDGGKDHNGRHKFADKRIGFGDHDGRKILSAEKTCIQPPEVIDFTHTETLCTTGMANMPANIESPRASPFLLDMKHAGQISRGFRINEDKSDPGEFHGYTSGKAAATFS